MVENRLSLLVEGLSDELWVEVLSWLEPKDLMLSAALMCPRFLALLRSKSYWKLHARCLLEIWKESELDRLSVRQIQTCCILANQVKKQQQGDESNSLQRHLKSLLPFREAAESIRYTTQQDPMQQRPRRVCLASSTDNPSEILEHVLTPVADIIPYRRVGIFALQLRKWWSSEPSPSQDSNETILLALNCPLGMVHQVSFKPLLDPYTQDRVYTWNHTEIRAYRLPIRKLDPDPSNARAGFPCTMQVDRVDNNDEERDDWRATVNSENDARAIERVLQNEAPVYQSALLPTQTTMEGTNTIKHPEETHVLPLGVLCNVICLVLHGKKFRQFQSSGFYCCLENVGIQGVPLAKPNHPNMKPIEAVLF